MIRRENCYHYWLPDHEGNRLERDTKSNAVVIIGANGSGKSKLGAWIESQDLDQVHRVGAQRSLNFSDHVPQKSFEEAEGELFYGSSVHDNQLLKGPRWNWGKEPTTKLLDDYDAALSAILAQYNNEVRRYFEACKQAESQDRTKPPTPITSLDRLYSIWNSIFSQRSLKMEDSRFLAMSQSNDSDDAVYSANQMSDGERSVLYLTAQVLCVPMNKIIIIDEPEIHLHPSIMRKLWNSLEKERPDCLFIYISHDVEFASIHTLADKIWVKSFDGKHWEWQPIEGSELPEELLLDLLGNRKNVLFVEGTNTSYDVQLYSRLYEEFYVVPCGGCEQVITNTKAFSNTEALHEMKAFGIIDRDYTSDDVLQGLENKGIYHLEVAEVENLFLVEGVVRALAKRVGEDPDDVFTAVRKYVIEERFEKVLESQILAATVSEMKRELSAIDVVGTNDEQARESFEENVRAVNYAKEHARQRERFYDVVKTGAYDDVLRVFNEKGLATTVGHFMGVDNKSYPQKVISLLDSDCKDEILNALRPYVPSIPV